MNILLQILDPTQPLKVAKDISELGVLVVIAGFFIVLSFYNLFRNSKTTEEIIKLQRDMFNLLKIVSEGIGDETIQQIKAYAQACIDNNRLRLYLEVIRIMNQYGIKDRDATLKRITSLVRNVYNERNNRFDLFVYKGKKLSEYVNPEWTTRVIDVLMESLYMEDFDTKKLYENLDVVYNDILNEFNRSLL